VASSGTYSWSPEVAEICDEAAERCGLDPATLTARHLRSARRSLDLLFSDWANRGPHLWAIDQQTIVPVVGTATYNCPAGTVAVLEVFVRRDGIDTPVFPMTRDEYAAIPDKTTQGLANRFWLNRDVATPTLTFWDVPENTTDRLIYYRMRQLQDIGAGSNTPDIPYRWQEAIAAGLAAKLAEKYAPEREQGLLAKALAKYQEAYTEDRERSPTTTRVKYTTSIRRR
jgi:hypothetical protein